MFEAKAVRLVAAVVVCGLMAACGGTSGGGASGGGAAGGGAAGGGAAGGGAAGGGAAGGGAAGGGAAGGGAPGGGTGGSGGGASSGGGSGKTDAARVTAWCQQTLTPHCAGWFSSQAQCEDAMKRTQTALCEAKWVAETDCLATVGASDWGCTSVGEPALATTACRDEYLFGSYCRVSMANANCNAGACQYDTDCPSGMGCNDKTLHCFKKTASCPGLPCKYDTDCPGTFKCNGALEQCVKS